jgi:rod shape-determining protein MreC
VLACCCLASIILMTVWVREGGGGALHRLRDLTSAITAPLQEFGSAVTRPLRSLGNLMSANAMSASEVQALQEENERLRYEVVRLQEFEMENHRLSELFGLSDAYSLDAVGARVILRTSDPYDRSITINKGTNSGIRVGMPVMSATGLIGRVEWAGPTSSGVRLITDQSSHVPVFIQGTRTEGMMDGSPDGTLHMSYVGLDVEVLPGATIVTSGGGGVYPKGIPVGTVQSVEFLPADPYQTIVIKPIGRLVRYEEVLVIIGSESDIRPDGSTQTQGP